MCGRDQLDTKNLQISTDLEPNRNSKKSTANLNKFEKTVRESSITENPNNHTPTNTTSLPANATTKTHILPHNQPATTTPLHHLPTQQQPSQHHLPTQQPPHHHETSETNNHHRNQKIRPITTTPLPKPLPPPQPPTQQPSNTQNSHH
jgi:hypothetical protein